MLALRIFSTWSEAVTAAVALIGLVVSVVIPLAKRFSHTRWLISGAGLVVAGAGLAVLLLRSSHSLHYKHASIPSSSRQPVVHISTAAELAQRARADQRHLARRHEQERLATFVEETMEHAVNCKSNEDLPPTATAQQVCRFGAMQTVYTRLNSVDATSAFFRARYFHSFPFSGDAGSRCGKAYPFRLAGPWRDGHGVPQGYWVFRTSGPDIVLLWEYRSHHIVVRASQNAHSPVHYLCDLWYSHSGETPPRG